MLAIVAPAVASDLVAISGKQVHSERGGAGGINGDGFDGGGFNGAGGVIGGAGGVLGGGGLLGGGLTL